MVSKFKVMRIKKNLSQKQLGELVGVSRSYIGFIENLKIQRLSETTATKLTEILGTDANDLLVGVEQ